jgi:hypothetical protein
MTPHMWNFCGWRKISSSVNTFIFLRNNFCGIFCIRFTVFWKGAVTYCWIWHLDNYDFSEAVFIIRQAGFPADLRFLRILRPFLISRMKLDILIIVIPTFPPLPSLFLFCFLHSCVYFLFVSFTRIILCQAIRIYV